MYAKDIVGQAQRWLGLRENNGGHRAIIDIYNAHKPLARDYKVKYTDAWCATFVSAVAIRTNSTDLIPTECSCGRMVQLMQQMGIWIEDESAQPLPGDIIFYDWDDTGRGNSTGWPDHVGIVENVKDGSITVIEGNLSNAVGHRTIAVNSRYIRGYGRPKYKAEEPAKPAKSLDEVAKAVINGDYGNGAARKQKLQAEGYNPEEVQARVNALLSDQQGTQTEQAVEYYPKYTGKSNSLVDALKSLGVNSAYAYRKQIAAANGITGYRGSAAQNSEMLNLLKQGKLIKAK